METPASSIESLYERVEAYSKTTYELSKLKLLETTTKIVTAKPANLFRSTFKEVVASRDLKDYLVSTSVGLAAGFLAKKVIGSITKSLFTRYFMTSLPFH
jgi:hypothetical protein